MTVHELTGKERDRIYDEQGRRYPGSADCARQPPAREPSQCSRCDVPSTLERIRQQLLNFGPVSIGGSRPLSMSIAARST